MPPAFAVHVFRIRCAVAIAVLAAPPVIRAAQPPDLRPANDSAIQLETFAVNENGFGRPYLYAEVPGFELLSPLSESATQTYAAELQRQRALLSVLIPSLASPLSDTPQAILLNDQPPTAAGTLLWGRTYALPEGVLRESLNAIRGVRPAGRSTPRGGSTISWSRASGPDNTVFYTGIHGFDYARQSSAGGVVAADRGLSHIFPLAAAYEHRRPRWPAWVEDGIDTLGTRFLSEQTMSVFMLTKLAPPPAELSVADIFSPPAADESASRRHTRLQAAAVLAAWALAEGDSSGMMGDDARRDAYWRLAARACSEPVTAAMFAAHFGPDAWDSVLRAWSRLAHSRPLQTVGTYWPEKKPVFPAVAVRRATRAESARIKSEYEWRIAREFATAAPTIAQQCLDLAGRRLRRAYAAGERDPRFLAVLALFAADVSPPAEARPFLEEAAATQVVRPRLYYQLARARETDEPAASAGEKLRLDQVRRVLEPLLVAHAQRPALREVYQLMAALWHQCAALPPTDDLRVLAEGQQFFPRDPTLAYNISLLHAKAGAVATARRIASQALPFSPPASDTQTRLQRLLQALPPSD